MSSETHFMFFQQQTGVLFADSLHGLQSKRIPDAISAGGFWLDVHTTSHEDTRTIANVRSATQQQYGLIDFVGFWYPPFDARGYLHGREA